MIRRRIAKLEAASVIRHRPRVVYVNEGESTENAIARFFEPYGSATWPVAVMPIPCETIDEWIERYAPDAAEHRIENRRPECRG